MTTLLLIWDQCGVEPIELYEVRGEHEPLVRQCQGQYINDSGLAEDAAIYELNELATSSDGNDYGLHLIPGFTRIHLPPDSDVTFRFDCIVVCGFIP